MPSLELQRTVMSPGTEQVHIIIKPNQNWQQDGTPLCPFPRVNSCNMTNKRGKPHDPAFILLSWQNITPKSRRTEEKAGQSCSKRASQTGGWDSRKRDFLERGNAKRKKAESSLFWVQNHEIIPLSGGLREQREHCKSWHNSSKLHLAQIALVSHICNNFKHTDEHNHLNSLIPLLPVCYDLLLQLHVIYLLLADKGMTNK